VAGWGWCVDSVPMQSRSSKKEPVTNQQVCLCLFVVGLLLLASSLSGFVHSVIQDAMFF
jgi:hypothetical protein